MSLTELRRIASEIELARRITHAAGGIPAALYVGDIISWAFLGVVLWVGVLLVFLLEYLRLERDVTHAIYRRLTRPYESSSVAAYAYYAVGMALGWLLFPPDVALLGAAALAIGDPLSGALSSPGAPWYRRSLSAFGVAGVAAASVFLLFSAQYTAVTLVSVALVAGAAAVIADMYTFRVRGTPVDDNLLLPIIPPAAALVLITGITILPL